MITASPSYRLSVVGEHLQGPTTKSAIRIDAGPEDATSSVYKARIVLRRGGIVGFGFCACGSRIQGLGACALYLVGWMSSVEFQSGRFATSQRGTWDSVRGMGR